MIEAEFCTCQLSSEATYFQTYMMASNLAKSPVTETQRARVWGGAVHTVKAAKAVVTSMYEAAGTSSLYVDCPIERAHRDIRAVAQHAVLGHIRIEDAGRAYLGLKPNFPLF